jgi:hypothetical protein
MASGTGSAKSPARRRTSSVPRHDAGLLRLRVERHDPAGLVPDQVDDRVGHLTTATEQLHLAEQHRAHAGPQLAFAEGLVEEGHLQEP